VPGAWLPGYLLAWASCTRHQRSSGAQRQGYWRPFSAPGTTTQLCTPSAVCSQAAPPAPTSPSPAAPSPCSRATATCCARWTAAAAPRCPACPATSAGSSTAAALAPAGPGSRRRRTGTRRCVGGRRAGALACSRGCCWAACLAGPPGRCSTRRRQGLAAGWRRRASSPGLVGNEGPPHRAPALLAAAAPAGLPDHRRQRGRQRRRGRLRHRAGGCAAACPSQQQPARRGAAGALHNVPHARCIQALKACPAPRHSHRRSTSCCCAHRRRRHDLVVPHVRRAPLRQPPL
jgi:hypothetical protein